MTVPPRDLRTARRQEVQMHLDGVFLQGEITYPDQEPRGLILFAHGSGSSRFSPRNQYVAYELHEAGFATCLFDLLSLEEEEADQTSGRYRFDTPMLARRLTEVTDWISRERADLPVGYFGASTGAAAALISASERPDRVRAVVSRGGRPDMATHALHHVRTPVLLLVGGRDEVVIELNRKAYEQLPPETPKELVIIPGAGHLFEEPGMLSKVSQFSARWFEQYL